MGYRGNYIRNISSTDVSGPTIMNLYLSAQNIINEKIQKDRPVKSINSWHPSKLGSCLTGAYLERLGVKPDEDFDERTLRVFSVGKMMEEWLVNLVKESGIKCEEQVRIELPEYNVTGYADLVVDREGQKEIYEVKSKHSKSFWYMEKKGQGAQEQHRMQLWTYLKALNIEKGRIVYISKDDLAILEFPVLLGDIVLGDKTTTELSTLNRAWKEKLPPKPVGDLEDWRAKYCRWHKQCVNQPKYL